MRGFPARVPIIGGVPSAGQAVPGAGLIGVACPSVTICEAVGYTAFSNQGVVTTIT